LNEAATTYGRSKAGLGRHLIPPISNWASRKVTTNKTLPQPHRVKFWVFRYYTALVVCSLVAVVALYRQGQINWQIFWAFVAGITSFGYAVLKQKLDEVRLFKDLFAEFNKRYENLAAELERIRTGELSAVLSQADIGILYKYFNLCGEEYLYYTHGFIYPEVWRAWYAGMLIFYKSERIRKVWDEELKTHSYYGLQMRE
jgi:hypothetical protein